MATPRILILTTSYLPLIGGSELAIAKIAERLPEFAFDIVTGHLDSVTSRHERMGNVEVFRAGGVFGRMWFLVPKAFLPIVLFTRAAMLLAKRQYIAAHAYQASQAAGAVWLLKFFFPHLPFILTLQEGKELGRQSPLIRMFRGWILRRADHITVISEYLRSYIRRIVSNTPTTLIPNGVDIEKFDAPMVPHERERIRERWGSPPGERVIISVSRLVEKNGLSDLVEAFAHLEHAVRLVLIGSGPLLDDLVSRVHKKKIADRVVFVGSVAPDQLPMLLKSADMFVRPSRSEGLGTAFLEAMAAGLPTIGTAVGGIPDFLKDGVTGVICKPEDPDSIAKAIQRILDDPQFAHAVAVRGRELVHSRYTWAHVAESMRGVYASLKP